VRRLFTFICGLGAMSCTELNARWNDHQVFFGTVRQPAAGATLANFCAETSVAHSDVIVFSAPVGAMVIEEVFVEGRTEKYTGTVPPDRDGAFWCSDAPQLYLRPVQPWICLRAGDDDPPAALSKVEPRGEMGTNGSSSGYALELEVRHAGVLRLVFDPQCLEERAGPGFDAGALVPHGELTIR
jgi:hypothetical protein